MLRFNLDHEVLSRPHAVRGVGWRMSGKRRPTPRASTTALMTEGRGSAGARDGVLVRIGRREARGVQRDGRSRSKWRRRFGSGGVWNEVHGSPRVVSFILRAYVFTDTCRYGHPITWRYSQGRPNPAELKAARAKHLNELGHERFGDRSGISRPPRSRVAGRCELRCGARTYQLIRTNRG